jgi:hypothetical protein
MQAISQHLQCVPLWDLVTFILSSCVGHIRECSTTPGTSSLTRGRRNELGEAGDARREWREPGPKPTSTGGINPSGYSLEQFGAYFIFFSFLWCWRWKPGPRTCWAHTPPWLKPSPFLNILFLKNFLGEGSTGVWTQGLTLASQALHQL